MRTGSKKIRGRKQEKAYAKSLSPIERNTHTIWQGQSTALPCFFNGIERRYAFGHSTAMKRYTITFSSITIAMKAQSVFRSEGIRTEIIRTPKNLASGCGYSLIYDGDLETAMYILENRGIKFKSIMENMI